jgi:hypothetical protein
LPLLLALLVLALALFVLTLALLVLTLLAAGLALLLILVLTLVGHFPTPFCLALERLGTTGRSATCSYVGRPTLR